MAIGSVASNEKAVLVALQLAFEDYGRPVSSREIIETANRYEVKARRTALTHKGVGPEFRVEDPSELTPLEEAGYHIRAGGFTEGGYNAFDFPDRVTRYLKRLSRKGEVTMEREGRVWVATPKKVLSEETRSLLTEEALLLERPGGSGFHEFEQKLLLEGTSE